MTDGSLDPANRSVDAAPDRSGDPTCLFCRIVRGELPARIVADDDLVLAFHDIAPRSPTHVLVIAKAHVASAADLTAADAELLGRMFATMAAIARDAGIAVAGYRIVSNVGRWGGQTVDHLHFHLMGGRAFGWPPG